jgi:mRNA interferase MazF
MASRADINWRAQQALGPKSKSTDDLLVFLAEQTAAVDPSRLGDGAGRLTFDEMRRIDAALRLVLGL